MRSSKPQPARPGLPQHANPAVERLSYAPYNFVPLPAAVLPARSADDPTPPPWEQHDRYLPDLHTGWFDLVLTAETPLYVRCGPPANHAAEDARTNRHRQNFFHQGDPERPVIPGSSLRGMLRNLVEIVAFARLSPGWCTDHRLIYRAVGDTTSLGFRYRDTVLGPNQTNPPRLFFDYPVDRLRGGYLRRRGPAWVIQPARTINGETFVHVEYEAARVGPHDPGRGYGKGDLVDLFIRPPAARTAPPRGNPNLTLRLARVADRADVLKPRRGEEPREGFVRAVLVRSGHPDGKHMHCAIYEPDPDAAAVAIEPALWQQYEADADLPRGLPARRLTDGAPLFYLLDPGGRLIFFGPTMLFRLPYPNAVAALIPSQVQKPPFAGLDVAEAIFGTVDRERKLAVKGRVFVEDARWDGLGVAFLHPGDRGRRTPKVLGTPRPTAFQHYLTQPEVTLSGGGMAPAGANRQTLCNYHHAHGAGPYDLPDHQGRTVATTAGTVIRGHKLYWHRPRVPESELFLPDLVRENDPRHEYASWKQMTIIRPVRPGTTFKGRLRFENLTDLELGALLTVLQLPASMRHRLGTGKPLGMGSVRLTATLHLTDRAARYAALFEESGRLATGERSGEETEQIAARCRKTFDTAVRTHYRQNSSGPPPLDNLWSIPRLRALAALLEWDKAPPLRRTGYAPPDVPPGEPLGWWRERLVLPTAEFVAGVETPRPAVAAAVREQAVRQLVYNAHQSVLCVLQEEKTKGGNWKAVIKGTEIKGDVVGTPPGDAAPGQEVTLTIRYFTPPKTASFWWPGAAPRKAAKGPRPQP
jgi:CRISPR-associated protein (TIGR03986 family)